MKKIITIMVFTIIFIQSYSEQNSLENLSNQSNTLWKKYKNSIYVVSGNKKIQLSKIGYDEYALAFIDNSGGASFNYSRPYKMQFNFKNNNIITMYPTTHRDNKLIINSKERGNKSNYSTIIEQFTKLKSFKFKLNNGNDIIFSLKGFKSAFDELAEYENNELIKGYNIKYFINDNGVFMEGYSEVYKGDKHIGTVCLLGSPYRREGYSYNRLTSYDQLRRYAYENGYRFSENGDEYFLVKKSGEHKTMWKSNFKLLGASSSGETHFMHTVYLSYEIDNSKEGIKDHEQLIEEIANAEIYRKIYRDLVDYTFNRARGNNSTLKK